MRSASSASTIVARQACIEQVSFVEASIAKGVGILLSGLGHTALEVRYLFPLALCCGSLLIPHDLSCAL